MSTAEALREFRAMGSECVVRIVGDESVIGPIADRCVDRVLALHDLWTRFSDDSELSRLNAANGSPFAVSDDTFAIVALALEAWRATHGLFDPTMLESLRDVGYDLTFDELSDRPPISITNEVGHTSGAGRVVLDAQSSTVTLPSGVQLDLGGIGKGRAADLVLERAIADGAVGACIDLGGDVRVGGTAVDGGGWGIVIDDPFHPGSDLAVLALGEGSVTTSSRLRRHWPTAEGDAHHLLDPATGRSAETDLVAVTVVAASAAWGEAHAKAALIAGVVDGIALLADAGLSALLITHQGDALRAGAIGDFLIESDHDRS